jgi:glycosyltransferase involved in cell wall biosynthesis
MAEGREEYMRVKRDEFVPQITVPLGIWDKRIPKPKLNQRNRYQIVFMGHILEKQGLDIVIEALPKILRKIPKAQLLIIGTGEYENILKAKVKKLKLEKSVIFAGFVESHKEVERKLSESILAVATYKPDPDSFTYFADPGKIKNYLSAGLPVILTRVPPIAGEIEKKKCAVITNYNSDDFSKIAIKFLSSARILKQYSKNAIEYAKNFDWENVFSKGLEKTL